MFVVAVLSGKGKVSRRTFRVPFAAAALALAMLCIAALSGRPAQASPLGRIDESQRVTLVGNTPPEANTASDRGPVADAFPLDHMLLLLRRSPRREQALEAAIERREDPGSADYHRWLSAADFGARFGPAKSVVAVIAEWLAAHGFRVNTVYPSRMIIDFSGTAGVVRRAFHTEIHYLDVAGKAHIANISDPQLPKALAAAVTGIVSLNDFPSRPMQAPPPYNYSSGCTDGSVIATCYAMVPADLAKIYHMDALYRAGITGAGETLVVIENSDLYSTNDWTTFEQTFDLARFGGSFELTHPDPASGPDNCADPGVGASDGEATLDAEWASAAAPGAKIVMAACAGTATTGGVLIALQNVVNAAVTPEIVSVSYGKCEADLGAAQNAAFAAIYQQAAMEGISVFAAAGDSGPGLCDGQSNVTVHGISVNGEASTRYDVAVGGTDFADTYEGANAAYWRSANGKKSGSAKSYIPEIPWNASCASALLADYLTGSPVTYGTNGFCNVAAGQKYLGNEGGGGGPSACAKGKPSIAGVVSGTCSGYRKPRWQKAVFGNPADGVRDVPDVALYASGGVWGHRYITCFSDPNGGRPCTGPLSGWSGTGGTSYATPIMAGIQALVDQATGARQGNPDPAYYQLAAREYGSREFGACNSSLGNAIGKSCIFHNVTLGDNDQPCTGTHDCYLPAGANGVLSTSDRAYRPSFRAGAGWNFATGLGSVDALNLVKNWPRPAVVGQAAR